MILNFLKASISLVIFFVLAYCRASSQQLPLEYKFHNYSPEGGFYYDGVKSIKQDKSGFIWIIMDNDLYRFDGYQYVSYYRYFQNLDSSVKWKFNNMETDTLGQLYVTANNKLFVHHSNSSRFECLPDSNINFLKTNSESERSTLQMALPHGITYTNIVWKDKTIWACSNKNKLYRIDSESAEIIDVYDFFDIPENYVNKLYVDQLQNIWIGTRRGLYVLNPQTNEYSLFRNIYNDSFSIPDNSIWTINEDRQQNIWIGTYSGGLCYVNPKEKKHFKAYSPKVAAINYHIVSGFTETGEELWIATEGAGINVIDKKTGNFSYKKYNPGENSLAYNNVKSMVTDSVRKNVWISMFQGGLDCYRIPTKTFTHYKNNPTDTNSLRFNNLRKIVLESDSGLWIAYQAPELLISYFSF